MQKAITPAKTVFAPPPMQCHSRTITGKAKSLDAVLGLGSFILAVPAALLAALLVALAQWRRIVPHGRSSLLLGGLLFSGGYTLLYVATALDTLFFWPEKLQVRYLGQVHAGAFALQSYEHSGFQDPLDEWAYRLTDDSLRIFRQRCKPSNDPSDTRCHLYQGMDDRWFANVWIDGDHLFIRDGLH